MFTDYFLMMYNRSFLFQKYRPHIRFFFLIRKDNTGWSVFLIIVLPVEGCEINDHKFNTSVSSQMYFEYLVLLEVSVRSHLEAAEVNRISSGEILLLVSIALFENEQKHTSKHSPKQTYWCGVKIFSYSLFIHYPLLLTSYLFSVSS